MEEKFIYQNKHAIFAFILLILINKIIDVSTLSCDISAPDSIVSQKLNNIICIGPIDFANVNLANFSDGSLVVESSKDINGSNQRFFYGITKEGKPYFDNDQYLISFYTNSRMNRSESENFVITINDETNSEYLVSFGYDTNVEIYDLNAKKEKNYNNTKPFINNKDMVSLRQTGFSHCEGSIHYFYHGYITSDFFFI